MIEREPDYTNVVFLDEYPHLIARRDAKIALEGVKRIVNSKIIKFPERQSEEPEPPDDAA